MRPAAAFAEMTNEVQQPAIEEAVKTGDAATIEEAPAEDATEEQPEEDVIQPEEPSSDAVETPSDETVANEGESTGDGTESAAETVDGTEATTPTEGADPPPRTKQASEQPSDEAAIQAVTYAHTATAEQNGSRSPWAGTTRPQAPQPRSTSRRPAAPPPQRPAWTYRRTGTPTAAPRASATPRAPNGATTTSWGAEGYDFTFELTTSGSYYINFYFMDTETNVWYLRTTAIATVNDEARPSVTQIINNAVAQCGAETTGSEYDVALWLHDWAMDQLEYDRSLNYYSAESGLTRGQGTCESYQRIYAKLLNAAGIANGRIEGNGHTWNAARIDGKWGNAIPLSQIESRIRLGMKKTWSSAIGMIFSDQA